LETDLPPLVGLLVFYGALTVAVLDYLFERRAREAIFRGRLRWNRSDEVRVRGGVVVTLVFAGAVTYIYFFQ
jgi:hypothetical protein